MARFNLHIEVAMKDEETGKRIRNFPVNEELQEHFIDEIAFLINGVHLVDNEGGIYVLNVILAEPA